MTTARQVAAGDAARAPGEAAAALRVLVGYATRHGATAGIAERIADRLREADLDAEVAPVVAVRDPARYEAFVIGSAAYLGHWLEEATAFVVRHRVLLADRPVWLFSNGPTGAEVVDEDGRPVAPAARPKEFGELHALVRPVEMRVFPGASDPEAPALSAAERWLRRVPASWASALPAGDVRDWPAIDAWAAGIARTLTSGS